MIIEIKVTISLRPLRRGEIREIPRIRDKDIVERIKGDIAQTECSKLGRLRTLLKKGRRLS